MGTRRDVASRRSTPSGHVATTTRQRGPFSRCRGSLFSLPFPKWGNKHTVHGYYFAGYVGTLAQAKQICVDCFEDDIDDSLKELSTVELRGKNLACWCA